MSPSLMVGRVCFCFAFGVEGTSVVMVCLTGVKPWAVGLRLELEELEDVALPCEGERLVW